MAMLMNKRFLQKLYGCYYSKECLDNSILIGYTKRDYEDAINIIDRIERGVSHREFKQIFRGRTLLEQEILKKYDNFI